MRFLFVDEIVSLAPGEHIVCHYTWPSSLDLFQDHFPGFPVVPGVLLTEAMGQAGAICLEEGSQANGKAMLVKIRDAAFRGWVAPDQQVSLEAKVALVNSRVARIEASARVNDKLTASCNLMFAWESSISVGQEGFDHPALARFRQQENSK